MNIRHFILCTACALLAAWSSACATTEAAGPVSEPVKIESRQVLSTLLAEGDTYTDAAKLMQVMTKAVEEHLQKDPCTPMAEIMKQAKERKSCEVDVPRESRRRMESTDLFDRVRKSTAVAAILFKCPNCPNYHLNCASAFVINKDGVFVTNYHVLDAVNQAKEGKLVFVTADGGLYSAKEVLAADAAKDLAVVKTTGTNLTPLPIAPDVSMGATVYCLSHPRNHFYTFTSGIVNGKIVNNEKGTPTRRLQITADYAVGSSGAAIVNECGSVVGVVSATSTVKTDGTKGDVQMVWKLTVPSMDLLELISKPKK